MGPWTDGRRLKWINTNIVVLNNSTQVNGHGPIGQRITYKYYIIRIPMTNFYIHQWTMGPWYQWTATTVDYTYMVVDDQLLHS
jgi:hypothetical protein